LAYGAKYSFVASLVPWYAMAALFFITAVSVQQIPLARGTSFALVPLLGIALLQLVLFCFHHDSLSALVTDQVIVLFAQMMVMSLYFLRRRKRRGAAVTSDIRLRHLVMLHPHFVLPGGAGRFVLETGSLLAERGYSVIVICIRADDAIIGAYRPRLQVIEIGGALTSTFRFWLLFPLSLWRVARVLRSVGPCVLFPQVFPANWWGFIYGLRHRDVPLLWMCHEPSAFIHVQAWIEALPSGLMKRCVKLANPILRRLDVWLAQRVDGVLCNSDYGKSMAGRIYGYPGGLVHTLSLGVDHEKFKCRKDVPRTPTAVCVGRLTKFKNVTLVVEAVKLLVERGRRDCALMIIGRGEEEPELHRTILAHGLQQHVKMCGAVDDRELVRILQSARAFVLASEGEPFGLTAVEAMATGTPALVIGDGGPEETVTHNVSGFHLPARDAVALADHLEKLFYDDELFRRLSKGASARAKQFSWETCVDGIEEAIGLLERKFAPGSYSAEIPKIRPA
jgi:glycosyltransferase involved in cell wall biosynthesis